MTLAAGMATLTLSNVPSDASGSVGIYDSANNVILTKYNTTNGANVQFDATTATAGDYYINVRTFGHPSEKGTDGNIPASMTQPWSFTVVNK